ncbi:hypothetical protein [Isosphaera pallida]|uniref:hypothetical protein n=1 Tax=Isosphaera pallida TaxID=128 RepID=UPI0002DC22A5|nr:hypothetical protein [Isosphaera pallida]
MAVAVADGAGVAGRGDEESELGAAMIQPPHHQGPNDPGLPYSTPTPPREPTRPSDPFTLDRRR